MKFKAACQERQAEKSVLTKNTKNDKSGFGMTCCVSHHIFRRHNSVYI